MRSWEVLPDEICSAIPKHIYMDSWFKPQFKFLVATKYVVDAKLYLIGTHLLRDCLRRWIAFLTWFASLVATYSGPVSAGPGGHCSS